MERIELYDHGLDIPHLTALYLDSRGHICIMYSFNPMLPEDLDPNYDSNSHALISTFSLRSLIGHSPSEIRNNEITPLLQGNTLCEKLHITAVTYLNHEIETRRDGSVQIILGLIDKTYLAKSNSGRPMDYLNFFQGLVKEAPKSPNSS